MRADNAIDGQTMSNPYFTGGTIGTQPKPTANAARARPDDTADINKRASARRRATAARLRLNEPQDARQTVTPATARRTSGRATGCSP